MKEELDREKSFEKLEQAVEGLRGAPNLDDQTSPAIKKWRDTKASLPKKHVKDFHEKAYQDSQNDKEWQEQQKYEKLFEKEIRPKTRVVWFWLGEKIVKEKKLLEEKERFKTHFISKEELDRERVQNIGVPETVDIDYSEIKDIPVAKTGGPLRPYKDGFLIIRDENPKHYQNFEISDYLTSNETKGGRMFFHTLNFKNNVHYYLRSNDVEKVARYQNNLSFYFVFKRAYKNKAFKITFKNNKYLTHIFKIFKKRLSRQENNIKDIISNLPSRITTNYMESLGILEHYESYHGTLPVPKLLEQGISQFSKKQVLKAGYYFSILSKFTRMIVTIAGVLRRNKGEKFKEQEKDTILSRFVNLDHKDFKSLTQKMVEVIGDAGITPKSIIPFVERVIAERTIKQEGLTDSLDLLKNIINLIISYQYTEEGTSLPLTGKIDVEDATEIDCFHYWNYISLFNLVNGCLDKKDFPLLLEEGKIFNDKEFHKHIREFKESIANSPFQNPNETFNLYPDTKTQISEILTEAMEQTTGLLIPYNACVELKDDPVFKYIRFIEYEKYIAIFAHDYNDRFIAEMYVKGEKEFRYWLYNSGQVFDSKVAESSQLLYLKLATCIRDWKVLIERDSTMLYRGRKVPTGVKSSKPRQIWLPRTSYKRSTNQEQKSREKIFFNESRKFSGDRRAHRRKLRNGMKASKLQMLLAKDVNFYVPDGYTFVKESVWGKIKMSQRQIKYRNTSLNGLFYASDAEVEKAKNIHNLSPAGFEEYCEKYVATLGWEVIKRNNYDGGIDIRALKEFKNGTIKQLFVQCKHWTKHISPGAMKEFKASCDEEKSEHEQVFMFITSSRYASGARTYAENYNIELIDGNDLLK